MDLKLGLRPKCKHCCLEILSIIVRSTKQRYYRRQQIPDSEKCRPKIKFILRHCNLGADHVERGYI